MAMYPDTKKKPDPPVASANELAALGNPARLSPPKKSAGRPAKAKYGLRLI